MQFWSEDAAERSLADRWMDWAQTTLQPDFLAGVFWGYYRTPPSGRNWPEVARCIRRCASHFRLLDEFLGDRPYLLGACLSLADIPIGTHLYRYFNLPIARPHAPNLEDWYRRLQERPAYRQHVMVPFDELRGRLEF